MGIRQDLRSVFVFVGAKKLVVFLGAMQLSPALRFLHSSKWHHFALGGWRSAGGSLSHPQSDGLGVQASGHRRLYTPPRVRVRV